MTNSKARCYATTMSLPKVKTRTKVLNVKIKCLQKINKWNDSGHSNFTLSFTSCLDQTVHKKIHHKLFHDFPLHSTLFWLLEKYFQNYELSNNIYSHYHIVMIISMNTSHGSAHTNNMVQYSYRYVSSHYFALDNRFHMYI